MFFWENVGRSRGRVVFVHFCRIAPCLLWVCEWGGGVDVRVGPNLDCECAD